VLSGLQFPFRFDPELLRADLAKVHAGEWRPHYNDADYGGQWRGAALRSPLGAPGDLSSQPPRGAPFAGTPLLERCPYFQKVLETFRCPLKSVRLLALAPGAFIREHTDDGLDYQDGEVRIHIPVQTNPDVEFYVSGERLDLEEGGCYYVNVNLPHRVNNRGSAERIHVVIDAEVDDWVREVFARGRPIARCPLPARGFEEFRRLAIQSGELRERLRGIAERHEFGARVVAMGHEAGFEFTEADVGASVERSTEAPQGWMPVKVHFRHGQAGAEWIWAGTRRLTEPFFEESVRAARRNPFTAQFRREMSLDAADAIEALTPTGFIFHMTRCGSTLIAQMLAGLDGAVVISEAPPVDDVIQAPLMMPKLSRAQQAQWLRQVVRALGQRRSGGESLYFVKLDAWHIHHLPLFREAFPAVPWVFVQRRAEEVVASQLRRPGMPGLPGALDPRLLGLRLEDVTSLSREQWCARVTGGFLEAAGAFRNDPSGLFVDHAQLPDAVWGSMARHFGIRFNDEEIMRMRERARFDAKTPAEIYPEQR
jgi:hypothetical protein